MKVGQSVTIYVDTTGKDYNGHVQALPEPAVPYSVSYPRKMRPATT